MITVLFRTVIIYVLLVITLRLMGKRQMGELEISDLATTFLISQIASLPITDNDLPVSHSVIPIITLLTLEVSVSFVLSRFPRLKTVLSARPTTLIKNGTVSQKAMRDTRLSFDELFSELRQQGFDDISQIKYAILERNGNVTVIQKARYRQPTADQLHLKPKETGLFHIVIEEGVINKHGADQLGISRASLEKSFALKGHKIKDVYLMVVNDAGESKIIYKEGKE